MKLKLEHWLILIAAMAILIGIAVTKGMVWIIGFLGTKFVGTEVLGLYVSVFFVLFIIGILLVPINRIKY